MRRIYINKSNEKTISTFPRILMHPNRIPNRFPKRVDMIVIQNESR